MRGARMISGLILTLASLSLHAQSSKQEITVTGKLARAMAIGGESSGWVVELDPAITVGGKQLSSIQVRDSKPEELEALANERVRITGKLGRRLGVETGEQPVLIVSSIKGAKAAPGAPAQRDAFSLSGSEWFLAELDGHPAEHGQATLTFPDGGKVAGNGSCNRFFGSAEINGESIKFSAMGSTRMACPEAVMNQEAKYLQALQVAERFEWKDPYLLIYCKGIEMPLRFTRTAPAKPATP